MSTYAKERPDCPQSSHTSGLTVLSCMTKQINHHCDMSTVLYSPRSWLNVSIQSPSAASKQSVRRRTCSSPSANYKRGTSPMSYGQSSQACKDLGLVISQKKTNMMGQDWDSPPIVTVDSSATNWVSSATSPTFRPPSATACPLMLKSTSVSGRQRLLQADPRLTSG